MNDYNGLVCDIASLIGFDTVGIDLKTVYSKFEDVMLKYNIPERTEGTNDKTDMRQLCECMLKDSINNNIDCFFLFGGEL